jgi:hypothetical protein
MHGAAESRWLTPFAIFALCAAIYVATLGSRVRGTSSDAHYVYLADSFLHGQLSVVGNRPPGTNDWSRYDGRWYVSFPPFPALVIAPAVWLAGVHVWDRLYWAVFAAFAPALLYLLLRRAREHGESRRTRAEDLALTALFAVGSVYYFCAVQGTVWFSAQVVASSLLALYLLAAYDARHPWLAGLCLGLLFMTRPTTMFFGVFFLVEAFKRARVDEAFVADDACSPLSNAWRWLRGCDWIMVLKRGAMFAVPLLAIGGIAMWMNAARFDDPFEFGHRYLEIRWRGRIDHWGLFNYHYVGRNLGVMLASLPWLSAATPFVKVSRHGLALWVTTPCLLWLLWPKRPSATLVGLYASAVLVAVLDLMYQNSGWIQFGYRFSLDYMVALVLLLALGGRRFGFGFYALLTCGVAVNLFGAITFDRAQQFYDNDGTQRVIYQPD